MRHTPDCYSAYQARLAKQAEYDQQWPQHCRSCGGRGFGVSYQSVPYGGTSADIEFIEPCPDCTEQGICARCGQPGLTSDERGDRSTGEGPCKACGWDYRGARPPDFECFCYEEAAGEVS